MTLTYRALDLPAEEMDAALLAEPTAVPLSGDILARNKFTWASEDKKIVTGAWKCERGRSRWDFAGHTEVITVLNGAMTVTEDGGSPVI